jgi:RNA recognition motif-containing protein
MNIYVGNLPYSTTEDELKNLFTQYGEVISAVIISDRYTGRSKGFGFVEMAVQREGETAIAELDGYLYNGRNLRVNMARPRNERPRRRNDDWY